jgi:hypothetical protein
MEAKEWKRRTAFVRNRRMIFLCFQGKIISINASTQGAYGADIRR